MQQQGAIDRYDDCFLVKVYNEVNEVWTDEFARAGASYEKPGLTFFTQAVSTGCGQASSQVGPFYCPPDRSIYLDIGFLDQLQRQFGAEGRYAQAYILAHEAGHHLQTLFGTERKVRSAQQPTPDAPTSCPWPSSCRRTATPACGAGWPTTRGNVSVGEAEVDQAHGAAEAVGDDRIQQKTQGRVDQESWTHGSATSAQWFTTGRQPVTSTPATPSADRFGRHPAPPEQGPVSHLAARTSTRSQPRSRSSGSKPK